MRSCGEVYCVVRVAGCTLDMNGFVAERRYRSPPGQARCHWLGGISIWLHRFRYSQTLSSFHSHFSFSPLRFSRLFPRPYCLGLLVFLIMPTGLLTRWF